MNTPAFRLLIRGNVLWIPGNRLLCFTYEAFTLCGRAFQPTSVRRTRRNPGPNTTFPCTHRAGIRFVLCGFQSPLLTASLLLSLLALTKMLQFWAFALTACAVSKWDVPLGNLWVKDCMRLATAFRSLPRPSSPLELSNPPDSMGASYLRPDL